MLQVMAGHDRLDTPSVDRPVDSYASALDVKTMPRIGVVRRPFFDDIDPQIESTINEALRQMRDLSADVLEIELPAIPTAVHAPEVYAVHAKYFSESPELYGPWMRERLRQAAAIDTVAYIEARQELDRVRRFVSDVFSDVDLLVTPTSPVPPITIREAMEMSPPPAGELWLRNTRPFNVYGLPTISIPCGFTGAGLPIGLQIAGPNFSEASLLAFAFAFEQMTK